MRRVVATGKEVRAAVGRMGQDNQRFGKVCPQRHLCAAYLLPIGNRR